MRWVDWLISRDEMDRAALVSVMKLVGGVLGVWEAHEILRGLKTLAVRMDRQCENARKTRQLSEASTRGIARVHYPGLGALVSIELRDEHAGSGVSVYGRVEAVRAFDESRRRFYERLASGDGFAPGFTPARRQELGIVDGLVRISVGIEKIDDIIADIKQALSTNTRWS